MLKRSRSSTEFKQKHQNKSPKSVTESSFFFDTFLFSIKPNKANPDLSVWVIKEDDSFNTHYSAKITYFRNRLDENEFYPPETEVYQTLMDFLSQIEFNLMEKVHVEELDNNFKILEDFFKNLMSLQSPSRDEEMHEQLDIMRALTLLTDPSLCF
jgi:hypothetical protein